MKDKNKELLDREVECRVAEDQKNFRGLSGVFNALHRESGELKPQRDNARKNRLAALKEKLAARKGYDFSLLQRLQYANANVNCR